MYCEKCGGKLESYASNCAFCGTPVKKYDAEVNYIKPAQPSLDYKPMTALKWIGLTLLNAIPLIGNLIYLILMFKWAFGSTKDLSLKGYARANLLVMLLALFAVIVFFVLTFMGMLELSSR